MHHSLEASLSREANIGVVFVIAAILTAVGVLAEDLRWLAYVGVPIGAACLAISRNRLLIATIAVGLIGIRSLISFAVTRSLWMLLMFGVSAAAVSLMVKVGARREQRRARSEVVPDDPR